MTESEMAGWFWLSYALLWVLCVTLSVAVFGLLRHVAFILEATDPMLRYSSAGSSLEIGQRLPPISLRDEGGGGHTSGELYGSPAVVLVVQPDCPPCTLLLNDVRSTLESDRDPGWKLLLIVVAGKEAGQDFRTTHKIDSNVDVLLDDERWAPKKWGVTSTPFLITVDANGHVRRKVAMVTSAQVRNVLERPPSAKLQARALTSAEVAAGGTR